jgi:hypothetical protein
VADWLGDYRDDGIRDWAAPTWREVAQIEAAYEQQIARLLQVIDDLQYELKVARGEPVRPRRPRDDLTPRYRGDCCAYDKEESR